ncbi:MAG: protein-disulfide reductase DsbD [Janthinobacterium lividum]
MVLGIAGLLLLLLASPAHAEDDYLAPDVAFRFAARMLDARTIEVRYDIADGYYMYRDRFAFTAEGATLAAPHYPQGTVKFDKTFQKNVETYRQSVVITIPVEAGSAFTLLASSQGCADQGLCYSPMEVQARLSPVSATGLLAVARDLFGKNEAGPVAPNASPVPSTTPGMSTPPVSPRNGTQGELTAAPRLPATAMSSSYAALDSEMGQIESSLKSRNLVLIMPLFLLLGLGLALTPCVLPMLPILSSIIVGDRACAGNGAASGRRRAFLLSLSYSLGMALVYTALGTAAGLIGEGLSATLQKPWVLGLFALLMAGMAMSMFGLWQMQMPAVLQGGLNRAAERQGSGRWLGSFFMGALSALIVGPCVAAPLAGALVYISQTRDVVVGASALFALAVGMSVPLLLLGLSAGSLLPRAGAWMEAVKSFFGVLMLGVALWMVTPVLPSWLVLMGWALLGTGYGSWLLWSGQRRWQGRAVGLLFAAFGLLELVGVASGGRDALMPLAHFGGRQDHKLVFMQVRSEAEFDAALAEHRGQPAMLDFYADWCVSCKEMENTTFTDAGVKAQLDRLLVLQIDVTANTADDRAMLKRFGLFGPPGILFFDGQGREITPARVIGYQDAQRFLNSLGLVQRTQG